MYLIANNSAVCHCVQSALWLAIPSPNFLNALHIQILWIIFIFLF